MLAKRMELLADKDNKVPQDRVRAKKRIGKRGQIGASIAMMGPRCDRQGPWGSGPSTASHISKPDPNPSSLGGNI